MLGLKAVGGVLGRIFGGGETIREGMKLIGEMHTSTEEELRAKTDAQVRLLEAYTGYKVAQRVLAIMFCSTFLIVFCIVMWMTLDTPEVTTADVIAVLNAFYIGPIVFLIVGFYFGGGVIEGGINAVKNRIPAGPSQGPGYGRVAPPVE